MVFVNGSAIYVRSETSEDWYQSIVFDAQIIALYPLNEDQEEDARMLCITEDSIQTMELDQKKERPVCGQEIKLPGEVISTQRSQ